MMKNLFLDYNIFQKFNCSYICTGLFYKLKFNEGIFYYSQAFRTSL